MSIHSHSPRDEGYRSRKFWLAVLALTLLFVGAVLCDVYPAMAGVYPTFAGSVVASLGAYYAVNATQKHLAGTAQAKLLPLVAPAEEAPVEPDKP